MRDSFGARLRRHREDRGVSLADVSEQTKIKSSLLDCLERDDISQWPAGIFRRAYVRAYAAAIGFEPDAAVREFLTLYPDPVEASDPPPAAPSGLRSLFGTFRRRTPSSIVVPSIAPAPAPAPPPQPSSGATATVGKRPAEPPPAEPVVPEPVIADAVAPAAASTHTQEGSDVDLHPQESLSAPSVASGEAFLAAAKVCTELGRVDEVGQVPPLLADAATILGARGLIVWVWDGIAEDLEPALVHGYPSKVRARLRGVKPDADNVTAAAYRAGAPLARSGALAVPLLAPSGCAGVLAIEVENGREQDAEVRALATFFAAMLAQLVAGAAADAAVPAPAAPRESMPQIASARLG